MSRELYSPELSHHGIKGQKWGVRRSQATLDRLAGRDAKRKKLESQANQGAKNWYRHPVKMNRQLSARKQLHDMDTQDMVRGKSVVQKSMIKSKRFFQRPAMSITGKQVSRGRSIAENVLVTIGVNMLVGDVNQAFLDRYTKE